MGSRKLVISMLRAGVNVHISLFRLCSHEAFCVCSFFRSSVVFWYAVEIQLINRFHLFLLRSCNMGMVSAVICNKNACGFSIALFSCVSKCNRTRSKPIKKCIVWTQPCSHSPSNPTNNYKLMFHAHLNISQLFFVFTLRNSRYLSIHWAHRHFMSNICRL